MKSQPPSLPSANALPPVSTAATEPMQAAMSTFWLIQSNSMAVPCAFVGTPKMLCMDASVDASKTVSDVMVSAACPVDVLVASRVASEVNWMLYAQAGKGLEVHGAALPLAASRTFTVALVPKSGQPSSMDVRCGVTTVWRPTHAQTAPGGSDSTTQPLSRPPEPTATKFGDTPGF